MSRAAPQQRFATSFVHTLQQEVAGRGRKSEAGNIIVIISSCEMGETLSQAAYRSWRSVSSSKNNILLFGYRYIYMGEPNLKLSDKKNKPKSISLVITVAQEDGAGGLLCCARVIRTLTLPIYQGIRYVQRTKKSVSWNVRRGSRPREGYIPGDKQQHHHHRLDTKAKLWAGVPKQTK